MKLLAFFPPFFFQSPTREGQENELSILRQRCKRIWWNKRQPSLIWMEETLYQLQTVGTRQTSDLERSGQV